MREHKLPLMAYSPIEQARLVRHAGLKEFAKRHGITPAQAALAWLLDRDDVIVIPKTGQRERVRENHGALAVRLDAAQRAELDALFPPPKGPRPLEML
jgi:aldehyde reductase